MPNQKLLPLKVVNDIEAQQSWEGISTPADIARYISRVLAIDPNGIVGLQEIVASSVEPSGDEAKKIWIKTTEPVGIGIPIGDGYRMLYEKPVNIPYLHIGSAENLPSYIRRLTTEELTNYKLDEPNSSIASWVIIPV